MPSGPSVYCTTDDINPSGPTSLQPLDISIDISHSALTLKGVTFHLHTMLIKIHPYGLKKKGGVGHFCTIYFGKLRRDEGINRRSADWRDYGKALWRLEDKSETKFQFSIMKSNQFLNNYH